MPGKLRQTEEIISKQREVEFWWVEVDRSVTSSNGPSVRPLWLVSGHRPAAGLRSMRQPQAGRADLAAGRAEDCGQATTAGASRATRL